MQIKQDDTYEVLSTVHGFINSNSFSLRFFTQGPQNPRPLRISNVTSFPYLWASCFQLGGLLDQQQPGSVVGWEGMPVTRSGGLVEASQEQGRPGGCCPEADRSGQLGAGARRSPTRALARRGLGLGMGRCHVLRRSEEDQVRWRPRAPSSYPLPQTSPCLPAHTEVPSPSLKGNCTGLSPF